MTEEGDKPAPTAEQEVLEDTDKPDQPVQANPPSQNETETEKETETPKPDNKTIEENRPAPTKTGKMVVCRVIMLDARTEDIEVDKGAEGKVLFDKVCKSIKLQEVEYFGLTYVGARDVKFWLSMDKKISKQLKGDRWVFEFAVKFYPPEPSFLLHDYTKYLLCLQVRIDVFNGRLPCSVVTHAILGAYTVQADIGDYESPREGRSEIDYLRDFDFAPTPSEELLHKIFDLHKTLKGMEDVDAEELFLENAKKLAMYGVDLHKAKDSQNVNILLGVCASGVTIYKDKLRINRFVWPKILKLSYKRSNFYIKLRPVEGDTSENSICFKLENHKMAKLVWKTCVEHHAFFRLKEAEPPRKGTNFPRFNSKFRYSGRTQKQIQDSAKTLDKQKEPFERRPIKRPDANYIDRNSDHPLDEKDRLDQMHRDPAMISSTGPPPYSQDADRLNQAESRADKPGYLPGEAEDRLDKEQDQGPDDATLTAGGARPESAELQHEVQGHTEVTSAEDESGQDKGLVKEIDNSKSNGRKKEVKFIDECESDKTEEELNSKQTNNVIEHVTEEIKPAVVTVVNTMPENTITTSNSEKQAVIEHDGQKLSEIKAINIVTQENTQEKKGDKSSEQVIPDENIEDEVFETEAESVEKTKEIKEDTKEETQKETEIQVDEVSKTEINPDIEVINEEKENIIVTKNESEVCDNNDKVDLKENNIEVLFGKELEKEAVKVEEDKVNEVSASPKEVSNIADKPELQGEEVNKEQEVDEPKVVNADEENEKKKEQREVVVNPGEVIEECVDKGEVILPVVVATEEAGNNQHEENDVEVTGADGGKEEDKVDEKEQKRLENEAQKKQKEEIKKEKERIKKEKQEKKRLEKEEKKKEKELKKKLDKEKKEKEKQMKKSKKSSSVSPAVEEIKEDECQGQTDAEAPPPSPVDPVQVELAVALQQRKKQNDEENNETKQDVNEPVESPENTPVQETNKTQECVKPSQEEAKDQPSQENVSSQDTDKPLDSSTPPEQEREATEKAEGGEESKQDQENGTKVEAVKPKKSKKEKKEKPKKEKKDKKKKHDSTGCFAFIKKPKKSESDEEPAPVEDMPTEPWNKDKQEEQEAVTEEVVQEEKVTPKQRGVGLGWALPAFEEMKERQAAAAAAREAKAGLDGEGEWPVDREGSIDRKMQFIAVTPPTTETKDVNGVPEEGGMPFFDPLGGSDVNGEPVKVKKVPPPVPPKGIRGSSDLDNVSEEDRLRYMGADGLYKTERDGMVETRMEKKVIISDDNNDIDHDQLLADAIRAVTEMDQNMSVEKIECTRQIEN